jgi:hypothetical protein
MVELARVRYFGMRYLLLWLGGFILDSLRKITY